MIQFVKKVIKGGKTKAKNIGTISRSDQGSFKTFKHATCSNPNTVIVIKHVEINGILIIREDTTVKHGTDVKKYAATCKKYAYKLMDFRSKYN